MQRTIPLWILVTVALAGCPAPADRQTGGETPATVESPAAETDGTSGAETAEAAGESIALSPENTVIEFVGIHKGDKPDPRRGSFAVFTGTAAVGDAGLQAVHLDIDTESLTTEIEKLTNHLKSPDFFSVREHPQAVFHATSIETGDDGQATITGDLTLLGKTQSITFPATISTEGGLKLDAEFTIDRTQFGMNFGTENVAEEVTITVKVGG